MRVLLGLALAALAACSGPAPQSPFDRLDADTVKHGERLATVLGCKGCHGKDLTGKDWSAPDFVDMYTANLTLSAQLHSVEELKVMIAHGRRPGGRELWDMPSFLFTRLPDEDMNALAQYLKTLKPIGKAPPEPVFYPAARKEMAQGIYRSSAVEAKAQFDNRGPDAGSEFERGREIVRASCAECHRIELDGKPTYPDEPVRPNLRMVAAYSEQDFLNLLITGKAAGNRELPMMSGVARRRFSQMTDAERKAVYAYLKRLGEVSS
jgi:mono/diheme cytochrome c family protein